MSAKKNSQQSKAAATSPAPALATAAPAPVVDTESSIPWIESSNPRRRLIGKIALVVLWVYVAALWVLALDQWFNWGIFGPKVPPVS